MFLVDSHCDSIQQCDMRRHGIVNPYNFSARCQQLQFVAMFCSWPGDTVEKCFQRAVRYIGNFYIAMNSESEKIVQVRTYADIERAFKEGKHAALMTVEGGTGVVEGLKVFNDFYNAGVRVFGLAWLSNQLAKSNRLESGEEDTGLTDYGREIVHEGNRLGMIFDVSHLSDKSFWDLAEIAKKPLIATHSNFRTLCSHSRNLTDDMAKHIIKTDGMIGLNLGREFVHDDHDKQDVEHYFKHVDYCLELGGEDHIGFGCDIDGLSGIYPTPLDETCSIHDRLIDFMLQKNYSETLVKKIVGENYLNYLKKYL